MALIGNNRRYRSHPDSYSNPRPLWGERRPCCPFRRVYTSLQKIGHGDPLPFYFSVWFLVFRGRPETGRGKEALWGKFSSCRGRIIELPARQRFYLPCQESPAGLLKTGLSPSHRDGLAMDRTEH